MIDFIIDTVGVNSLGFRVKSVTGHLGISEPKQQGEGKEDFTSVNHFLGKFKKKSPEITVELIGIFKDVPEVEGENPSPAISCITLAESALYSLYGKLIQPGERAFSHTDGTNSIGFNGIMHKGAKVTRYADTGRVIFEVALKLLKTNELTQIIPNS